MRVIPSSASSIRSHRVWLPTGRCPVPGVEGSEEGAAWVEETGCWEEGIDCLVTEMLSVNERLVEDPGMPLVGNTISI